jgi:hypothetical protein
MMSKLWKRELVAGILALGLLGYSPAFRALGRQEPGPGQPAPAQADVFAQADLDFRALYAGGRAATLAKLDPLIVVELDNLILIHSDRRIESKVVPPVYHRLKAISHIPLAIYVSLAPFGPAPLDAGRLEALRRFESQVSAVLGALDAAGLSAEQSRRSRLLLEQCRLFLDGVVSTGRYDPAALQAVTKAAGPLVLANASDAARAQIDAYHAQVCAWRQQFELSDLSRLRVLVLGMQMPRKHNVAVQYFAKLMGLADESRRLVYAEELSGEQQGLNLLATHQLDSELSEAFFGNRDRMEIDLLGNAASVYLDSFDFSR